MRKDSFDLGTWGRIPVSMHWTALLSFAWLYIIFWDVLATFIGAIALFALFVAHEFGHVFVLRRKRIAVTSITFLGLHGETAYNPYSAKPGDAIAVAWGGVLAQIVVLLAAIAASLAIPFQQIPFGDIVWPPIATVLIKFNVFILVVALLPIGPFDGHVAWQVIPRLRQKWRRKKAPIARAAPLPQPEPEPEPLLGEDEQRELEERARLEAGKLLQRLSGNSDKTPTDGKD